MNDTEPILCYIKDNLAYFTTLPLDEARGDDWNDAPYEHNAGPPYGDAEHPVYKLYYDGWTETPAQIANGNSRYSVDDINAGFIPWLTPLKYGSQTELIFAGTPITTFIAAILAGGGEIMVPKECLRWLDAAA